MLVVGICPTYMEQSNPNPFSWVKLNSPIPNTPRLINSYVWEGLRSSQESFNNRPELFDRGRRPQFSIRDYGVFERALFRPVCFTRNLGDRACKNFLCCFRVSQQ